MTNFTEDELKESKFLESAEEEKQTPIVKKPKEVKQYINPEQFKKDVSVNMVDLTNAFIQQPALAAYYGMQLAKADEQMGNFKMIMDVTEAKLGTIHRRAIIAEGNKPTELMIAERVNGDKRFIAARKNYNEAKGVFEMLRAATEAFRHRRDMLIQLGTNERQERKSESYFNRPREESDDQPIEKRPSQRRVARD